MHIVAAEVPCRQCSLARQWFVATRKPTKALEAAWIEEIFLSPTAWSNARARIWYLAQNTLSVKGSGCQETQGDIPGCFRWREVSRVPHKQADGSAQGTS